ncbi:MAG: hypothetical protein II797_05505 [Clostridia bacterium]|nr:hypothetical protein [Clostridia bacterium]
MDRNDYTDPICPFDFDQYRPAPGDFRSSGAIPIREIIQQLDRLYAREEFEKAGEHLFSWMEEARRRGDKKGELSILNELLGYLRQYGAMEEEDEVISRTRELMQEVDLGSSDTAGTILLNIGTALSASGKPREALLSYSDAFRSWGTILDPADERFAALFNNMAGAYEASGETEYAKTYYLRAIYILENKGACPDLAVSYVNLAKLLFDCGEEEETVKKNVMRALQILLEEAKEKNAYFAYTCRKLQDPLLYMGYFRESNRLRKEADEFYERSRES